MGLMTSPACGVAIANHFRRTPKPALSQAMFAYHMANSVRLTSKPYRKEMDAFEALHLQTRNKGFVFGIVDSLSLEVVSFYERLPKSDKHEPPQ